MKTDINVCHVFHFGSNALSFARACHSHYILIRNFHHKSADFVKQETQSMVRTLRECLRCHLTALWSGYSVVNKIDSEFPFELKSHSHENQHPFFEIKWKICSSDIVWCNWYFMYDQIERCTVHVHIAYLTYLYCSNAECKNKTNFHSTIL